MYKRSITALPCAPRPYSTHASSTRAARASRATVTLQHGSIEDCTTCDLFLIPPARAARIPSAIARLSRTPVAAGPVAHPMHMHMDMHMFTAHRAPGRDACAVSLRCRLAASPPILGCCCCRRSAGTRRRPRLLHASRRDRKSVVRRQSRPETQLSSRSVCCGAPTETPKR